jgi:hypothetical protein
MFIRLIIKIIVQTIAEVIAGSRISVIPNAPVHVPHSRIPVFPLFPKFYSSPKIRFFNSFNENFFHGHAQHAMHLPWQASHKVRCQFSLHLQRRGIVELYYGPL